MRVLAVDPGLTRCGVAVVEGLGGRRAHAIAAGVVRTDAGDRLELRLLRLAEGLEEWIGQHSPDVVAIERVFSQVNVRTVMGTAQASGVAALVAARAGLPLAMYTPSEVKAAVTGSGRAGKAQVTQMVTRILGLEAPVRPADTADALALALCHLWRGAASDRLAAAVASARLRRPVGPSP